MNTYLIISETIYNINEKVNELTEGISNIVSFNMEENTIDEILQEASYFSMFDEKKCIIVKNSKLFHSSKKDESKKSKDDSDKLLKYLENENKNTLLIFTTLNKCDSKKKIYNVIKNAGNLFLYDNKTKTEMKNKLKEIVYNNKYEINDNSLWYIINNTLGNFDLCINELNKIMIYYSNPCVIKYEDVIELTSRSIENNNFKLVDAIISRDLKESLKVLKDAQTLKVESSVILSLLYREFKLMLSSILYEEMGYTSMEIMKELNLSSWQYDKVRNNLRIYNKREIMEEIVNIGKLDYQLKSGLINKDTLLMSYIIELCS